MHVGSLDAVGHGKFEASGVVHIQVEDESVIHAINKHSSLVLAHLLCLSGSGQTDGLGSLIGAGAVLQSEEHLDNSGIIHGDALVAVIGFAKLGVGNEGGMDQADIVAGGGHINVLQRPGVAAQVSIFISCDCCLRRNLDFLGHCQSSAGGVHQLQQSHVISVDRADSGCIVRSAVHHEFYRKTSFICQSFFCNLQFNGGLVCCQGSAREHGNHHDEGKQKRKESFCFHCESSSL